MTTSRVCGMRFRSADMDMPRVNRCSCGGVGAAYPGYTTAGLPRTMVRAHCLNEPVRWVRVTDIKAGVLRPA